MEGFSQALQTVLANLFVWPSVFTALPCPSLQEQWEILVPRCHL